MQGWGSASAIYGWAVLLCNLFLCLAHFESYRAMFALRSAPRSVGEAAAVPQGASA